MTSDECVLFVCSTVSVILPVIVARYTIVKVSISVCAY